MIILHTDNTITLHTITIIIILHTITLIIILHTDNTFDLYQHTIIQYTDNIFSVYQHNIENIEDVHSNDTRI